jgi:hypothetical protein
MRIMMITGAAVMAAVGGIMNITVIITSQTGVIMLSHLLFMLRRPLFIINSRQCVIISNRLCSITRNHSSIRKTVYGCRGKWAFKMIARFLTNGQLCCKIKFPINPLLVSYNAV